MEKFNLPVTFTDVDIELLIETLDRAKKVKQGTIVWILLEGVGSSVLRNDVPIDLIAEIHSELNVSKKR